ncbi:phosphotransferase family protein [Frankia sp. AiPa1]|nr:phosphotransferase family protein [Frankia sp. AiPa1]
MSGQSMSDQSASDQGRSDNHELDRLVTWLRSQLPSATGLRLVNHDRLTLGHSADMVMLSLAWTADGTEHSRDAVLRFEPPSPGLLEPYDLPRQVRILRALETSDVRGPAVLWSDEHGELLGRPFYIMERLPGSVYEQVIPAELDARPETIRRMTESLVEQLAAIHRVDLRATGLTALGDGRSYLDKQLDHWTAEMRRVARGPLPGLERLATELRARQPEPSEAVTLVHGDPKPGNFAFVDGEVSGVFDWEMADVGDPLADLGYLELLWRTPSFFTARPSALTFAEACAHYERLAGIPVRGLPWYSAFQTYKTAVILLVGTMLFDAGHTDDPRFATMSMAIPYYTRRALSRLGVEGDIDPGPVNARSERLALLAGSPAPARQPSTGRDDKA